MNRKRIILLLLAMLLTVTVVLLPLQAGLGFGDFDSESDYGESDYGGSDYSGSDNDRSDYSSSDYDGSDSQSNSRSSNSGGSHQINSQTVFGGLAAFAFLILFAAGIYGLVFLFIKLPKFFRRKKRVRTWAGKQTHMAEFRRHNPNFNEQELLDWCKRLFEEMQEAWEKGDITTVQYGFLPDTWNKYNTQLQMKNECGETTHVRDIHFVRVAVRDYAHTQTNENLTVQILVEYNVWMTDRTGSNIQGNPKTRHRMDYCWTLQRPYGSVSEKKVADETHCPNCGAELDIAAFAECPFCKAQIGRKSEGWLLADITATFQETLLSK